MPMNQPFCTSHDESHALLLLITMFAVSVLSVVLPVATASAATAVKLTGSPIGSPSVDYASGGRSLTVNQPSAAFDADMATYYASYGMQYTWVGLDLGRPHVISFVRFAASSSPEGNMQLGVFEGANEADFSDAIPFCVVKDSPLGGRLYTERVTCSRGFRYVRYVGPEGSRCNVAELEFYGTEGAGDDSRLYQLTNLPLVVIRTLGEAEVTSRVTYIDGWLTTISNDGTTFFTDTLKIRGRGNGSWEVSNNLAYGGQVWRKKPFRLKLAHKARLLDMPAKAKNWVLINNLSDKTLMRNMVAFEASRRLGMDYTPAARLVDVMYNGELKGTYQLCDKIEAGKNRIEMTEMEPTDNAGEALTGGYLIEITANQDRDAANSIFQSARGVPVTIKEPDDDDLTTQQYDYIGEAFSRMEATVFAPDYTSPASGYPSTLDVDAFLKHFLTGELCGTTDNYWSVYMSKDRGEDEKFKCCTVWDFDLALENDARTYPINTVAGYLCFSGKSSAARGMKDFARRIVNTQEQRISELWNEARHERGLTADVMLAFVDSLAQELQQSQAYNFLRWPILDILVQQNFQTLGSFDSEVAFMKQFIIDRIAWLDQKAGYRADYTSVSSQRPTLGGTVYASGRTIVMAGFDAGCTYRVCSAGGQCLGVGQTSASSAVCAVSPGVYIVTVGNGQDARQQRKILVR